MLSIRKQAQRSFLPNQTVQPFRAASSLGKATKSTRGVKQMQNPLLMILNMFQNILKDLEISQHVSKWIELSQDLSKDHQHQNQKQKPIAKQSNTKNERPRMEMRCTKINIKHETEPSIITNTQKPTISITAQRKPTNKVRTNNVAIEIANPTTIT